MQPSASAARGQAWHSVSFMHGLGPALQLHARAHACALSLQGLPSNVLPGQREFHLKTKRLVLQLLAQEGYRAEYSSTR